MSPHPGKLLMSVDVEDWFQVENLQGGIPRESWEGRELRVERNVDLILELLRTGSSRSTFFVLGWVAERLPQVVRKVHAEGHEIACHGHGHGLVYKLSPASFREDVSRSKRLLEDTTGAPVVGYRAPNFSITDWAVDVLLELGFRYDSSLFPTIAHDRYGKLVNLPSGDAGVLEIRPGFYEILLSCLRMGGKNIPWAGGGYFRLIPYRLFRSGIGRIVRQTGLYSFYIHPWEFDPDQPRVENIKSQYRLRHYTNLGKTEPRFKRLVKDFRFVPYRDALPLPGGTPARP